MTVPIASIDHFDLVFVQVYILIGLLRRKANAKLSIRALSMQTEAPNLASEFIYVRAAASQWIRYSQY